MVVSLLQNNSKLGGSYWKLEVPMYISQGLKYAFSLKISFPWTSSAVGLPINDFECDHLKTYIKNNQ